MKELDKVLKGGIIAMIPVYVEGKGNSTKIIFEKYEDLYIHNRTRTVLKLIADYYTVDLRSIRREYGKGIESKNMIPIPLNKRDVLIQIKTRRPISKNDGSTGYFNLRYIEKIVKKDDDIYIRTTKGEEIKVLNRERTIIKHINDGRLVKQIYNERIDSYIKEEPINYKTPATKEDIALLIREIVDIKNRL
ncbi:hypothetical protein GOQ27_06765 [Clostridium sp. D2Q-11]|uniref:Uncharacterized protein n=1 Tax=Anaeromonas frigoriresistens TaxID=2683708 RepID=A0A942V184_9FIRM|nr:hypothetical protein [Anaeromonas frigoriresistens]MBS4538157.1 hypothetical protein [Anaeromonas frigoriresistens]